jgi:hypothetical protein
LEAQAEAAQNAREARQAILDTHQTLQFLDNVVSAIVARQIASSSTNPLPNPEQDDTIFGTPLSSDQLARHYSAIAITDSPRLSVATRADPPDYDTSFSLPPTRISSRNDGRHALDEQSQGPSIRLRY